MKSINEIPRGSYCYETIYKGARPLHELDILSTDLAYYLNNTERINCPYFRPAKYGIIYCDFLGVGAVAVSDGAYERALKHFGSEEELEKEATAFLLGDAVRICDDEVKKIENMQKQENSKDKSP
ncbi:MAG: hypothetical protein WCQ99_16825 [Pseudomonadota bacterium]